MGWISQLQACVAGDYARKKKIQTERIENGKKDARTAERPHRDAAEVTAGEEPGQKE